MLVLVCVYVGWFIVLILVLFVCGVLGCYLGVLWVWVVTRALVCLLLVWDLAGEFWSCRYWRLVWFVVW